MHTLGSRCVHVQCSAPFKAVKTQVRPATLDQRSQHRSTCSTQASVQQDVKQHEKEAIQGELSRNFTNSRRQTILAAVCSSMLASLTLPSHASKLPGFADRAWEALGGGPSDLTFPDQFLGVWNVASVLIQVDTPLGEDMVPDMNVVRRALKEDLNQTVRYQVAFIRNRDGQVVFDRAFNTASMLSFYYDRPATDFLPRINWDRNDPNVLQLSMPGGLAIRTRVTRRSEDTPGADRIETSEYFEQVFDSSDMSESNGPSPKLKASQCFTKYRFRDETNLQEGQPAIVATQVVSDYLNPITSGEQKYLQAMNKPVTVYTYRIAFSRDRAAT